MGKKTRQIPNKIQWIDEAEKKIKNKNILLIDEIDDTRSTLSYCLKELLTYDPSEIAVCVLHNKQKEKRVLTDCDTAYNRFKNHRFSTYCRISLHSFTTISPCGRLTTSVQLLQYNIVFQPTVSSSYIRVKQSNVLNDCQPAYIRFDTRRFSTYCLLILHSFKKSLFF